MNVIKPADRSSSQLLEQLEQSSRRLFVTRLLAMGVGALLASSVSGPALGLMAAADSNQNQHHKGVVFDEVLAQAFRAWFALIVKQQFSLGPTPRWVQRDCAGLVRFAVQESVRKHDKRWLKANGFWGQKTPPELDLSPKTIAQLGWKTVDGRLSNWVSALELIQSNTRWMGKDVNQAQVADLLFFDQGDAQHLMICLGNYIAYHTGQHNRDDNGLRAYTLAQLFQWKDVRWQPRQDNPNFSGIYRLAFL